jgi:hypothetical protein
MVGAVRGTSSAGRVVTASARALILLRAQWICVLVLVVVVPWTGMMYGESAWVVVGRDSVVVPARVVERRPVFHSRGKGMKPWSGARVRARFEHAGAVGFAVGEVGVVPPDGWVQARVPRARPDLAVAFVAPGPYYRDEPLWSGFLCALALAGVAMMTHYNLGLLRRVQRGLLARARCVQQRAYRSTVVLEVTYATSRGTLRTERRLDAREARRVLAEPEPLLAYDEAERGEIFILAEVAGLRCDAAGDGAVTGSWWRVAFGASPLMMLAAAISVALTTSRLLPP